MSNFLTRSLLLFLLSFCVGWVCHNSPQPKAGDHKGVIMSLPSSVLHYQSKRESAGKAERDILPPDTEFEKRNYFSPADKSWLNCSIVLSGQDRTSIHRPEICLKAQGWDLIEGESGVRRIKLSNGKEQNVMDLVLERWHEMPDGNLKRLRGHYYFWFVGKNKVTPHHHTRIIATAIDNIFHSINHRWAYVSVMMFVTGSVEDGGMDDPTTVKRIEEFIAEAVPKFQTTFQG